VIALASWTPTARITKPTRTFGQIISSFGCSDFKDCFGGEIRSKLDRTTQQAVDGFPSGLVHPHACAQIRIY
jgi:hypothetical protein